MSPALANEFQWATSKDPDSFSVTKFSEVDIFGFILLGKIDKWTSLEEVGTEWKKCLPSDCLQSPNSGLLHFPAVAEASQQQLGEGLPTILA